MFDAPTLLFAYNIFFDIKLLHIYYLTGMRNAIASYFCLKRNARKLHGHHLLDIYNFATSSRVRPKARPGILQERA